MLGKKIEFHNLLALKWAHIVLIKFKEIWHNVKKKKNYKKIHVSWKHNSYESC